MIKPTINEVLPLVRAYYAKDGNEAGGNLHVVLDDGNYELQHIESAYNRCLEVDDKDGLELCRLLSLMSTTQRKKIVRFI